MTAQRHNVRRDVGGYTVARPGFGSVITAAALSVIPELLAPILVPGYGAIKPLRLTLTVALAACLIAGFRWARWIFALLVGLGLLTIAVAVGIGVGVWDTPRILHVVLLAGPYSIAMALLFFSSGAKQYFSSKSTQRGDRAMNVKDMLAGLGGLLIMAAFLIVGLAITAVFIFGAAWGSAKLLPWFSVLTWIAFAIVVLILLPLAIPRATRGFSSVALFIASYIFGATLWMEGLLLTLAIWGLGAVFIGLFLMGVGVVPIAMLATLLKGMWIPLVELVLLTIMTIGSRVGAMSLAESLES